MKKITFTLIVTITLSFAFYPQYGYSTVWTIEASNYVFTPSELLSVHLGDTIRWVWIEGSHTTTSSTIPSGATSWDVPLNSSSTEYFYVPAVAGTYNYVCTPHESLGMVGDFTVSEASGLFDFEYNNLVRIFPNPFTISTTIEYSLNTPQRVKITFSDSFGRVVDKIIQNQPQGLQKIVWTPEGLNEGIYYYRLEAGDQKKSGKIILTE